MASDADKTRKEFPLILRTDVGGIEETSLARYFIAREPIDSVNRGVRKRLIIRAMTLYLAAVAQEKIIDPEARIDFLSEDYMELLCNADVSVRAPTERGQIQDEVVKRSQSQTASKRAPSEPAEPVRQKEKPIEHPKVETRVSTVTVSPVVEMKTPEVAMPLQQDDIKSRRMRMAQQSGLGSGV